MSDDEGTYWNPPSADQEVRPLRTRQPVEPGDKRHSGRASGPPGREGRKRKWGWKKKALVWTSGVMACLLLAVGGVVGYVYVHLNSNLKSTPLLPPGVTQAAEIPNKFGQTPLNILVIGSDTRDTSADCALGHDCAGSDNFAAGQRADVEMVVHLSADRTNMTVMSIPRDTITELPSCAGAGSGEDLINAALNGGPQCQVQEVGSLTGLTIDGYVMADMGAVVGLTDAMGPVNVCVTNNVLDVDSGLKLPKGTSAIVGVQALEWLRSRHAFLNEPQREEAQHLFLSAMIRKLEAEGSLTNVSLLYSVANVATKSLTVSNNLGSVVDLLSLAQQMGKVPASRITMLTMPWEPYAGPDSQWDQQLQVSQPAASQMFAALRADRPYTASVAPAASGTAGGSATGTGTAPAAASGVLMTGNPVNDSAVKVSVVNDSGVTGRALVVRDGLSGAGFTEATDTTGSSSIAQTTIYYPSGRSDSAAAVADALNIPAAQVKESGSYDEVTVEVGKDWLSGTTYGTGGSSSGGAAPAAPAAPPPAESMENFASDANACMVVSSPEW